MGSGKNGNGIRTELDTYLRKLAPVGDELGGMPIPPDATFEKTVISDESNGFVANICRRIGLSETVEFNPLFIYGDHGVGRTHLLHATGNAFRDQLPKERVVYTTFRLFRKLFHLSQEVGKARAYTEHFLGCGLLLMDNVEEVMAEDSASDAFFEVFDHLLNNEGRMVFTCDRTPRKLEWLDPAYQARFEGGVVTKLLPLDFNGRLEMIKAAQALHGVDLPVDIEISLAKHFSTSVKELKETLDQLLRIKQHPNADAWRNAIGHVIFDAQIARQFQTNALGTGSLDPGNAYLIQGGARERRILGIISHCLRDGRNGMFLTTSTPEKFRRTYFIYTHGVIGLDDLARDAGDEFADLLLGHIAEFIRENPGGLLFLEDFLFFKEKLGFLDAVNLLKSLVDTAALSGTMLVVASNPFEYSDNERIIVEREFDRII